MRNSRFFHGAEGAYFIATVKIARSVFPSCENNTYYKCRKKERTYFGLITPKMAAANKAQ